MKKEFRAIIERDGEWFIGYCPEIPGANGQGRTKEACLADLRRAVELILNDRQEGSGGGPTRAQDDQP
jgi:predicted RNase H-like HicB family nuclease